MLKIEGIFDWLQINSQSFSLDGEDMIHVFTNGEITIENVDNDYYEVSSSYNLNGNYCIKYYSSQKVIEHLNDELKGWEL